jgi:hypothetical protein
MAIAWTIGVELELLAPRGSSRRALADTYARAAGGVVTPFFHPQSEMSLVPGKPVFENLTLGFAVQGAGGDAIASCVDDLTLVDDLVREAPPRDGWFRVVGDDTRLLNLVARHGRADAGPREAIAPVAALFGTEVEEPAPGTFRVVDRNRSPIAIATPLPGERERPCEIVSPPIARDHEARIDALLSPARALGFTIPQEAAVHVHFDAARFRDARAIKALVHHLAPRLAELRRDFATNPRCRRLGAWPPALFDVIDAPGFDALSWPEAQAQLQTVDPPLTKYCDINLRNLVYDIPDKPTIELRILPGALDAAPVVAAAARFAGLLREALASP